jgi:hypothetical protein
MSVTMSVPPSVTEGQWIAAIKEGVEANGLL